MASRCIPAPGATRFATRASRAVVAEAPRCEPGNVTRALASSVALTADDPCWGSNRSRTSTVGLEIQSRARHGFAEWKRRSTPTRAARVSSHDQLDFHLCPRSPADRIACGHRSPRRIRHALPQYFIELRPGRGDTTITAPPSVVSVRVRESAVKQVREAGRARSSEGGGPPAVFLSLANGDRVGKAQPLRRPARTAWLSQPTFLDPLSRSQRRQRRHHGEIESAASRSKLSSNS